MKPLLNDFPEMPFLKSSEFAEIRHWMSRTEDTLRGLREQIAELELKTRHLSTR